MSGSVEIGGAAGTSLLRASLSRTGKWAGGLGVVGGFVADILSPLAPFAAYIALAAAVTAVILAAAIAFRVVLAATALPALVFASTTAALTGGLFALQQASDAEDGVLAGLVPAIAGLQQSMGIVAASVEKIEQTVTETAKTVETVKQTTQEVRQTAEKVEQKTEEIAANQAKQQEQAAKLQATTEQIAVSIDTIADGFKALASQGGIIADPKRPDEFYHNARVHELSGDMLNARRSYLAFAGFGVDAVDPYIRFATLIRVQEGKAGAREVLGALGGANKTLALKLVHAMQFEDAQRVERLNAFVAANPDYPPAYFVLSEEFSEDRLGVQTLADKRSEATALAKFVAYEKDGGLLSHFIDHTLLADWLERSRSRLAALGDVLDPARFMPRLTPMRSNQEWMMTVSLPEPATAISWRLGGEGAFTETGFLAMNDQVTGKPMPNPSFVVPDRASADVIAIKYLDLRGREAGPFEIRFDPQAALSEGSKQILDQFWTSWIAFDAGSNTGYVYFTHMLSYRCAIKEVHYSFNGAALDKIIDMPPCDEKDPYAIPYDYRPYFEIGKDIISMSVQVTYSDGTQSPVREFQR